MHTRTRISPYPGCPRLNVDRFAPHAETRTRHGFSLWGCLFGSVSRRPIRTGDGPVETGSNRCGRQQLGNADHLCCARFRRSAAAPIAVAIGPPEASMGGPRLECGANLFVERPDAERWAERRSLAFGGERPSARHRAARRSQTRSGDRRMPSPAVPHCMLWRSLPPFSRGPCTRSLRRRRVSRTLAAPRDIRNARPPQPSRNEPSRAGPTPDASGPPDAPPTPSLWLRSRADADPAVPAATNAMLRRLSRGAEPASLKKFRHRAPFSRHRVAFQW